MGQTDLPRELLSLPLMTCSLPGILLRASEGDVHCAALGGLGLYLVGVFEPAEVVPQIDPATEENGRDRDMQLVDKPDLQELSHGADAPPYSHILSVGA